MTAVTPGAPASARRAQTTVPSLDVERVQMALMNILEDAADEKEKLEEAQRATFNILEDFSTATQRLVSTQSAVFNILDDFAGENEKMEEAFRALLNILDDMNAEREKLDVANANLGREVTRRRELASIVENSDDAIIGKTLDGVITSWNQAAERLFGYKAEEAVGQPVKRLVPPHLWDEEPRIVARLKAGEKIEHYETVRVAKGGRLIPVALTISPIKDERGNIVGASKIARDVTERLHAEEVLKRSLEEKEILLREIHHRVKNNLQVVASLLSLQSNNMTDETARRAFEESRARVKSMALVHETLYQGKDLANVDFASYVKRLTGEIRESFVVTKPLTYRLDLAEARLPVDVAIPCGLILTELISNCHKHAYPGERTGEIEIRLVSTAEGWSFSVSDDGVGLPAGFDPARSPTLGFRLIQALARQLSAALHVEGGQGTRVRFSVPRRPGGA